MEDVIINSLRIDLCSIKEAGYNRKFAREYLYHRYVPCNRLSRETFYRIMDEYFKEER
jgi:hypothetical protein